MQFPLTLEACCEQKSINNKYFDVYLLISGIFPLMFLPHIQEPRSERDRRKFFSLPYRHEFALYFMLYLGPRYDLLIFIFNETSASTFYEIQILEGNFFVSVSECR